MPQTFSKTARHLIQLGTRQPMATPVDMTGRHVIVTGASPNSLGFETALKGGSGHSRMPWGTYIDTYRFRTDLILMQDG